MNCVAAFIFLGDREGGGMEMACDDVLHATKYLFLLCLQAICLRYSKRYDITENGDGKRMAIII